MKKILILHDTQKYQIFSFLNYLLGQYAAIHTEVVPGVLYDCILVDESLILSEEIGYLQLLKENSSYQKTVIISCAEQLEYIETDDVVFEYADVRYSIEIFLTLYERELEEFFGTLFNLPIEWRTINRKSN